MDYLPILISLGSAALGVFGNTTYPNTFRPTRLGWLVISLAIAAAGQAIWNTTTDLRERSSFRSQVHQDIEIGVEQLLNPYFRYYASEMKSGRPSEPQLDALLSDGYIAQLQRLDVFAASKDSRYGRRLREFEVLALSAEAGTGTLRSALSYGSVNLSLPVRTATIAVMNSDFLKRQRARSDTLQRLLDEYEWRESIRREQEASSIAAKSTLSNTLKPQFVLPPQERRDLTLVAEYKAFLETIRVLQASLKA